MSDALRRLSARLNRWPRRIAALACLLLAAGAAVRPKTASTPVPHGIGATLHAGEVAVSLPVTGSVDGLRAGDRVGVLAVPSEGSAGHAELVADRLRVLSVRAGDLDGSGSAVVVATSRAGALRLARDATQALRLIVDDLP